MAQPHRSPSRAPRSLAVTGLHGVPWETLRGHGAGSFQEAGAQVRTRPTTPGEEARLQVLPVPTAPFHPLLSRLQHPWPRWPGLPSTGLSEACIPNLALSPAITCKEQGLQSPSPPQPHFPCLGPRVTVSPRPLSTLLPKPLFCPSHCNPSGTHWPPPEEGTSLRPKDPRAQGPLSCSTAPQAHRLFGDRAAHRGNTTNKGSRNNGRIHLELGRPH